MLYEGSRRQIDCAELNDDLVVPLINFQAGHDIKNFCARIYLCLLPQHQPFLASSEKNQLRY